LPHQRISTTSAGADAVADDVQGNLRRDDWQTGRTHGMAAYLIADVDITDAAVFDQYRREVPATEERYGGRYLARGGATKVFEGDWHPHRLVIIEFPDMASLSAWYDSPEYERLKEIRFRSARTRILAVEGIALSPT
jgi:uncharacterized protein (DUF1330 family)